MVRSTAIFHFLSLRMIISSPFHTLHFAFRIFLALFHSPEEGDGFLNILREWGRKLQEISGCRVDEAERCGMKGLTLEPPEALPEGQWFN